MRVMLDTNICIRILTGRPVAVDRLEANEGNIGISAIVLSELEFGIAKSTRPAANRRALDAFLGLVAVVDFDATAAAHFGDLKQHLFAAGTPIGPFDMLIAAHARSCGVTLVTNNLGEFRRVPGLAVEDWSASPPAAESTQS